MRICFTILVCLLLLGTTANFSSGKMPYDSSAYAGTKATVDLGIASIRLPEVQSAPAARIASAAKVCNISVIAPMRKNIAIGARTMAVMLFRYVMGRLF